MHFNRMHPGYVGYCGKCLSCSYCINAIHMLAVIALESSAVDAGPLGALPATDDPLGLNVTASGLNVTATDSTDHATAPPAEHSQPERNVTTSTALLDPLQDAGHHTTTSTSAPAPAQPYGSTPHILSPAPLSPAAHSMQLQQPSRSATASPLGSLRGGQPGASTVAGEGTADGISLGPLDPVADRLASTCISPAPPEDPTLESSTINELLQKVCAALHCAPHCI